MLNAQPRLRSTNCLLAILTESKFSNLDWVNFSTQLRGEKERLTVKLLRRYRSRILETLGVLTEGAAPMSLRVQWVLARLVEASLNRSTVFVSRLLEVDFNCSPKKGEVPIVYCANRRPPFWCPFKCAKVIGKKQANEYKNRFSLNSASLTYVKQPYQLILLIKVVSSALCKQSWFNR